MAQRMPSLLASFSSACIAQPSLMPVYVARPVSRSHECSGPTPG